MTRSLRRLFRRLTGRGREDRSQRRAARRQREHSDRRRVLETLGNVSVGAEIGVWKGDFSAQILGTVRPRRFYLIDPWRYTTDPKLRGAKYGGKLGRGQEDMERVHRSVVERFSEQIDAGVVVIHRMTSEDAAGQIEDDSLDWVYIDGDHAYEGVSKDIRIYADKVRPGGLVCGDDYMDLPGRWWKGDVKRAVDEAVASGALELVFIDGDQFVLRRPTNGG